MADEVITEPQTLAEASAAVHAAGVPAIVNEPDAPVEIDEEGAALDELTPKPAAGAGADPGVPGSVGTPTDAPAVPDPFAAYGGKEAVDNAIEVANALRTETGVRLLVKQGLTALGYTDAQIAASLGGGPSVEPVASSGAPAAPADPYADLDDDDVITGADFKRHLADATKAAAEQAAAAVRAEVTPLAAQLEAQRNAEIIQRNDATLAELLGPTPTDQKEAAQHGALVRSVLNAATAYLDPNSFDPGHIRAAITQGHADVVAAKEAEFQAYLAKKRTARAAAPANIGGQAAGEAPPSEPKNLQEAFAQAREMGIRG